MASPLRPVLSLLLGAAFILAGNGLQFTLLPLSGEAFYFSPSDLGLIGSAYYVGFVGGCLVAPYLVQRAGHIRAFAAMVATASATILGHILVVDPHMWMVLRMVTGFCLAGLYLIIESWLNDRATNENRGLIMSAYIVVNFAAITGGQMMVTLNPITSFRSFAIASVLSSLAVIPVALTRSAQPAPLAIVRFNPLPLYRAAPVGIIGVFMIGVANGAFWSLGPLFATGNGMSVDDAAIFMSLAVLAGALSQWPAGQVSDHFDRRKVLAVLLALGAAAGFALWKAPMHPTTLMVLGVVFGALTLPGYSLAAAHAYDKTPAGGYVQTATTVLLSNGVGSIFGPALASLLMGRLGPSSLFLFTAVVQLLLLAYIVLRIMVRHPTPKADKSAFDLPATAPVAGPIVPPEPPAGGSTGDGPRPAA
ncbi:MFS transporter [Pseudoxanthobacter sp.]|uniref:MFS transporter n=1 Tax=Pseudoxanthobacter sp. TaxID=1925742 RepID=UPI002FE349ED